MNMKVAAAVFCGSLWLNSSALGTVYDFSTAAGVDRFAFGESIPQAPVPPTASTVPSVPVPAAAYGAIATSNDAHYSTAVVEGGRLAAMRFVFRIGEPAASVTRINVLWEGRATEDKTQTLWLWNAAAASYVLVGSQTRNTPPDGTITGSFTTNASGFVDANNAVTLLVNYNDSGSALLTDYVSVTITRTARCGADADCDDGLFCTGAEVCDPVAGCRPGTLVSCDDGLVCTIDSCNEGTDSCDNVTTDCDDGVFCNGAESCYPVAGCQRGTPVNCNDGVACTVDSCNENTGACDHVVNHVACSNGVFCDGFEVCNAVLGCQPGTPVGCDDGLACTTDICNEITNSCDNIPNDPTCIAPNVWYVDPTATGANDGTIWSDALNRLQDALAAAVYGDEIWVASGTYRPDEGAYQTPRDRSATFQLRNGVALYGGFAGGETSRGAREVLLNQTILSGDIGVVGNATDNSYHVVTGSGTDDTAVLDGFIVTGGNAPAYGIPDALGGGVLVDGGSPRLVNCTFGGNAAGGGGGLGNTDGNPTLIDCTFAGNTADIGGGMYNLSGKPTLVNCTFSANAANHPGGGMAEMFGAATLTNCTFARNVAGESGGALYVYWPTAQPTLANCLFIDNSAAIVGGGIYNRGGSTLANSTLSGNHAGWGGGVYTTSNVSVANSILWGNTAVNAIGEAAQISGSVVLINYSAVEGWTGSLGGAGNIGGAPLFANPAAADFHLSPGSPCLDAGSNFSVPAGVTTDLDGGPRFMDDPTVPDTGRGTPPVVDMGTYERGVGCSSDTDCDDGAYCNGAERCGASGFCQPGTPVGCSPQLRVSPASLDFTLAPGQTGVSQITLTNDGTAAAHWSAVGVRSQAAGLAPAPGPGAGQQAAMAWTTPHEPNTLLVAFKPVRGEKRHKLTTAERKRVRSERERIHRRLGVTKLRSCKTLPVDLVRVPTGSDLETLAAEYAALPEVEFVEPNYVLHADMVPNDPSFDTLWGLHNTGQVGGMPDADIDAPEAWDIVTGSQEVTVAVIDTGIDYTHPELAANMWTNNTEINGIAGVDDDGNGVVDDIYGARWTSGTGAPTSGDPYDDHYHGTHVAGTIGAAGNNNLGVVGVNWTVKLMALKFLDSGGSGYLMDAISAIDYAAQQGARISNNSWGGGGYSHALKGAIDAAGGAGHLFIAAAGNDAQNTDVIAHYPSSYDSPTILSVAATDRNGQRSWFSNWGRLTVDLAAPGSDILSTAPGNSYRTLSGTSMATPHVSGVAALILAQNPAISVLDLKRTIMDNVAPLPAMAGLTVTGGRVNALQSLAGVPWFTVSPETGTLNPGDSVLIDVVVDATGLAAGFSDSGSAHITSDDPNSPHDVPVSLGVTGCSVAADCDDGLFCNGTESCDASGACLPGSAVNCNDRVACTVDSCNEATDACDHAPGQAACDNGLFCDGAETCDAALGCQAGRLPDCSGLTGQCSVGVCDEAARACAARPVAGGTPCDNGDGCGGDACQAGVCKPATCGPPPPAPPTMLKGGFGTKVELEWKASVGPNVAGYNVHRATTRGGPYTRIAALGLVKAYKDFPARGSYCYVVTARNAGGTESAYSNEVCGVVR